MTVSDVVTEFQYKYPACSSSRAIALFNDVYREFCMRSQIRNKMESLTLVANQELYDYPAGVYQIHDSYYMPSSDPGSWFPLTDTSIDEFINKWFGWRLTTQESSQPTKIYTTSAPDGNSAKGQIGIWQAPPTSTDMSSGYPKVGFWVTSFVALGADDDIPSQVLSSRIFLYGMYALWSADMSPADFAMNGELAEREMNRNVIFVKGLQVHKPTEQIPLSTVRQTRVI